MSENFFSSSDSAEELEILSRKAVQFLPGGIKKNSPIFSFGQGEYLYDIGGRPYIDLSSAALHLPSGHGDADIIAAIQQQCEQILHSCNLFYNHEAALLAEALVSLTFRGKVFFCNSANESLEAAFKLARSYGQLKKEGAFTILSHLNSSHGNTLAALCASGDSERRSQLGPLLPGNIYLPEDDIEIMEECFVQNENRLCAFFIELLNSSKDMQPIKKEYMQRARQLCDKHDLLLVINENYTAPARSGKLFCYEHYDIIPDLLTLGGPMGAGMPFGALLAREQASSYLSRGKHGSTFGGNHLACKTAYQLLRFVANEELLSHVKIISDYLFRRLQALQENYSFIEEVRGLGLAVAIELPEIAAEIKEACLKQGLLLNMAQNRYLHLCPPLNISLERMAAILDRFEVSLKKYH